MTSLDPQSDEIVEQFNKVSESKLRIFVKEHQDDWDQYIFLIMMAYRSAVQETIGRTPVSIILEKKL